MNTTARPLFLKARYREIPGGLAAFWTLVLFLAACSPHRPIGEPWPEVSDRFSLSGESALPEQWWRSFGDPVLDALIEAGLERNNNLQAVWDRLFQAEAVSRIEGSGLFPRVDPEAGAGGSAFRDGKGPAGGGTTVRTTELSLGAAAAYELDLWGRIRAARHAAILETHAQAEDLEAAAISLAAAIAVTWYQLVEQHSQIDLIDRQRETNQQVLDLVTLRFRRGLVGAPDVLRQRQLVESHRGDLALAQSRASVLEHQLAVLLGYQPGFWEPPQRIAELVTLPGLPETGVPAELLRRRPDIRRAMLETRAADQRVAVALAERFPRISLSARGETSGEKASELFRNWLASLSANLIAPLIDGGRRKAEAARARSALDERLHLLEQAVLLALGEVEDALVRERRQDELIDSLERQLALAEEVIERVKRRYTRGAADYLRILDALQTHQALQRNLLAARRARIELRIDLCRALAGGWSMDRPRRTLTSAQPPSGEKLPGTQDGRPSKESQGDGMPRIEERL